MWPRAILEKLSFLHVIWAFPEVSALPTSVWPFYDLYMTLPWPLYDPSMTSVWPHHDLTILPEPIMTRVTKLTMAEAGWSGSSSANTWHALSVALPCLRATKPKNLQHRNRYMKNNHTDRLWKLTTFSDLTSVFSKQDMKNDKLFSRHQWIANAGSLTLDV